MGAPGDTLIYVIRIENLGEGVANDVVIVDPLSDKVEHFDLVNQINWNLYNSYGIRKGLAMAIDNYEGENGGWNYVGGGRRYNKDGILFYWHAENQSFGSSSDDFDNISTIETDKITVTLPDVEGHYQWQVSYAVVVK